MLDRICRAIFRSADAGEHRFRIIQGGGVNAASATDAELLAAAAQAVLTTFRDQLQREQLPPTSLAALRLLETALILYQDRGLGRDEG